MLFKLGEAIKPLFSDRPLRRVVVLSAVFNILAWAIVILRSTAVIMSGKMVALQYNVYLKVSDVGTAWWLFLPPAIGTLILIINTWLIARICVRNRQHGLVLVVVTAFYELLLLSAVVFMAYINLYR